MSVEKLAQNSFVSGQYDRSVQHNEKTALVGTGFSKGLNVLSGEKGELRKRLGTKLLKELNGASVVVPFRHNGNDLLLVFGENTLNYYAYDGENIVDYTASTEQKNTLVWTGNTTSGYTVSSNYQNPADLYKVFTKVTGATQQGYNWTGGTSSWTTTFRDNYNVAIELPNNGIIGKFDVRFTANFPQAYAPTSGYNGWTDGFIQYSDDGEDWTTANSYITSSIGPSAYKNSITIPITVGGHSAYYSLNTIEFSIVLSDNVGEHKYWRLVFKDCEYSGQMVSSGVYSLYVGFYERTIAQETTFVDTDITNLKAIKYSQNKNFMKIADGEHTPKSIVHTGTLDYSDFTPTDRQQIWEQTGYPSCVTYFQNRLWFGGFDADPNRILASKFGNETSFLPNTPSQYEDPLDLTCNQLKERITNMVGGQKELYCFSQDGLSMVDGGANGMLATNQSIEFVLRNRMPAGDNTPAFKDDVMLYGSSDGTKLYGVDFDLLINRFQVEDIAKYAKDIVNSKITEIHYIDNEAKLIYGLMENGQMFAINFSKGQFAGFFPLEIDGTVYDIASIKQGRDYKLLMVTNRNGHWYLEEKLDQGEYLDTDNPLLNDQDKKEATIKNLNNIALDCYTEFSFSRDTQANIVNEKLRCEEDLDNARYMLENGTDYVVVDITGKEEVVDTDYLYSWTSQEQRANPMYISWNMERASEFDKDGKFAFKTFSGTKITIYYNTPNPTLADYAYVWNNNKWNPVSSYVLGRAPNRDTEGKFGWYMPSGPYSGYTFYTTTETPSIGEALETVNTSSGEVVSTTTVSWATDNLPEDTVYTTTLDVREYTPVYKGFDDLIAIVQSVGTNTIVVAGKEYTRDSTKDITKTYSGKQYSFDLIDQVGESKSFTKIYNEIEEFENIHKGLKIGVIASGRYFEYEDSESIVKLPTSAFKVVYGIVYSAYAFLEIQKPYESMKSIKQLAVKVQDTMHLEVGTSLDDLRAIEEINDGSFFDLSPITMNRSYVMVPSDTPEWKKYIIVKSDKGLPFTINAIECIINYSSQGGF